MTGTYVFTVMHETFLSYVDGGSKDFRKRNRKKKKQRDTGKQTLVKNGSPSQTHTSLFMAQGVTFSQRCHQPWNFPAIFCQEMLSCRDKREVGAGAEGQGAREEEVDWLHRKCREQRHEGCLFVLCTFFLFFCVNASCLLPALISRCLTGSLLAVMCWHRGAPTGSGQRLIPLFSEHRGSSLQGTPQVGRAAGTDGDRRGFNSAGFGRSISLSDPVGNCWSVQRGTSCMFPPLEKMCLSDVLVFSQHGNHF